MVPRLSRYETNQIKCSTKCLKEEGRNVLMDSEQRGVLVTTGHQTLGRKGPELQADRFYPPTSRLALETPILEAPVA